MSRGVIVMGWDDVPHLSQETKDSLLAIIPAHERNPRTKGIPESTVRKLDPAEQATTMDFIKTLRSKATFTNQEVAKLYDVDESTVRRKLLEPNGPLQLAKNMKRITAKSIADHLGVTLEGK